MTKLFKASLILFAACGLNAFIMLSPRVAAAQNVDPNIDTLDRLKRKLDRSLVPSAPAVPKQEDEAEDESEDKPRSRKDSHSNKKVKTKTASQKHSPINCPDKGKLMGEFPPEGKEAWCELEVDDLQVKHGPYFKWYSSGKKLREGYFVNGARQGYFKYWNNRGDLLNEGAFNRDLQDGVWKYYFPSRGQGEGSGKIKSVITYKDGLEHGKTEEFYSNGTPARTGNFVEGQKEGNWLYYDKNGMLTSQGQYRKGQKIGIWTEFDRQGRVKKTRDYSPAVAAPQAGSGSSQSPLDEEDGEFKEL